MDIMFINKKAMLKAVDKVIKYRSLIPLDNRTKGEVLKALSVIIRHYRRAGFSIKRIECDGEFKSLMDEIMGKLNIDVNYANPSDHVPEAERNNRVIKERFRISYHRLPYKIIPKVMIKSLAMRVTKNLNLFPAKGVVSSHYSPHMILSQRNLDYKKFCQIEFGAYVQDVQDNGMDKNTNKPRTIDAIYLRPERNNRVIKEGFRIAYHRLPYKIIPRVMIKSLAMRVTKNLNLFPAKGGFSSHYSPHMILSQRNLDYKSSVR